MPGQEEKEMLVQLAELRQQMVAMSTSVEEIKSSVREVIQLDRTIAELSIHYQQQARGHIPLRATIALLKPMEWRRVPLASIDCDRLAHTFDTALQSTQGPFQHAQFQRSGGRCRKHLLHNP